MEALKRRLYLNFISRLEIVRSHDNERKRKSIIEQPCNAWNERKKPKKTKHESRFRVTTSYPPSKIKRQRRRRSNQTSVHCTPSRSISKAMQSKVKQLSIASLSILMKTHLSLSLSLSISFYRESINENNNNHEKIAYITRSFVAARMERLFLLFSSMYE